MKRTERRTHRRLVERAERRPLHVVIECAESDDPATIERVIDALADLLSGKLG